MRQGFKPLPDWGKASENLTQPRKLYRFKILKIFAKIE